jgi:dimethylglycine catabolism B
MDRLEVETGNSQSINPAFAQVMDDIQLRGCIQCGDCSGICPFGYVMEFPPSRVIAALRSKTLERITATDTVWMCISCSACTSVCPAHIPITVNLMARIKEGLILAGNVPGELQSALENSQRYGNPMGESPRKRTDWFKNAGSSVGTVPVFGKECREADVLWFVGDYASYHPRAQAATRALVKVLNALEVNFAILGAEENSDGDSQRLAGERGLFELLAEKNSKVFSKYQFNTILTSDPHAYNALRTEYPVLGISYPVQHITQFLAERLHQLKPLLKQEVKAVVAYHDPCYLGRVSGIYDAPRVLLSAIPGVKLVEMVHHHSTSLCCGGGGGGMWLDGFQWDKVTSLPITKGLNGNPNALRLSERRVKEALRTGAQILAIACPYEAPRFEDAIKTIPNVSSLIVKDIIELLAESMG